MLQLQYYNNAWHYNNNNNKCYDFRLERTQIEKLDQCQLRKHCGGDIVELRETNCHYWQLLRYIYIIVTHYTLNKVISIRNEHLHLMYCPFMGVKQMRILIYTNIVNISIIYMQSKYTNTYQFDCNSSSLAKWRLGED